MLLFDRNGEYAGLIGYQEERSRAWPVCAACSEAENVADGASHPRRRIWYNRAIRLSKCFGLLHCSVLPKTDMRNPDILVISQRFRPHLPKPRPCRKFSRIPADPAAISAPGSRRRCFPLTNR